jgi:hypothetical protein
MPEIGATCESVEGLNVKGQLSQWWECVAVAFPIAQMRMRLRDRERQIASAVAVFADAILAVAVAIAVAIAVAAVVVVVVVIDGVGVNRCLASPSAPEVHVLPGQGRRRRASRGGGVFPWGRRRRGSDPMVIE